MLKIKPKSEVNEDEKQQQNNTDVLREISKSLQLKPPGQQLKEKLTKKRTYYYNYGTAITNSTNTDDSKPADAPAHITRSVSTGSVLNHPQHSLLLEDLNLNFNLNINKQPAVQSQQQQRPVTSSLLDLDFSKTSIPVNLTLNKVIPDSANNANNNLYNIDEDKEVESSFQQGILPKKASLTGSNMSSSPANVVLNGRFTPACFPGRTTPDFRHTTSFFEQQGTRASIVSPLTINGGSEIVPIAIAFTETIHAYFKMGDSSKFKVKCFGCMKISFPFAILKLIAIELPQLEFRLSQLQIANQDLKINNQLLNRSGGSTGGDFENLTFQFINANLIGELKQQHQQNKLAAFFNFELLKYEFKYGASTPPPLVINANWSSNPAEPNTFELNFDYLFNFRKQLAQVNFMVILPPGVDDNGQPVRASLVSSEPSALTQENDNKLQVLWQTPMINANGRMRAKFSLASPTSSLEQFYQPIYTKFHIDNETLSQVKFQILSPNYKLSLLKEKIETGRFFFSF